MSKKTLGLLGKQLEHSFSKKYFSEKFARKNITDFEYKNFQLETLDNFAALWNENPSLVGLNVTIPYKKAVIPFLAKLNTHAEKIGAVNVIKKRNDGSLKGYNTDYYGFQKSLMPLLEPSHKKALVLGTGGASKAVQYALKNLQLDFKVVSRTPKKNQLSYNDLTKSTIKEHTVLINCTPLGTSPNTSECPPIPFKHLSAKHIAFDLIYNPTETEFLRKAKERGAVTQNGYEMLLLQADASWKIWKK